MDPQKIRRWLNVAALVLSALTTLIARLQEVDFTTPIAAIAGVALAVGYAVGKAQEAPGGVPKWKIPEHVRQYIQK